MKNKNIKIGDTVQIVHAPTHAMDKIGKIGEVVILASNGVIIQFPDGMCTSIKFENIKKIKPKPAQCRL